MENFLYQKLVPMTLPLLALAVALYRFKMMKLEKTFGTVLDFLLCGAVVAFSLIWASTIYSHAYNLGGNLPADVIVASNSIGWVLLITFFIFLFFIPFSRSVGRGLSKLKSIVFKKKG